MIVMITVAPEHWLMLVDQLRKPGNIVISTFMCGCGNLHQARILATHPESLRVSGLVV